MYHVSFNCTFLCFIETVLLLSVFYSFIVTFSAFILAPFFLHFLAIFCWPSSCLAGWIILWLHYCCTLDYFRWCEWSWQSL